MFRRQCHATRSQMVGETRQHHGFAMPSSMHLCDVCIKDNNLKNGGFATADLPPLECVNIIRSTKVFIFFPLQTLFGGSSQDVVGQFLMVRGWLNLSTPDSLMGLHPTEVDKSSGRSMFMQFREKSKYLNVGTGCPGEIPSKTFYLNPAFSRILRAFRRYLSFALASIFRTRQWQKILNLFRSPLPAWLPASLDIPNLRAMLNEPDIGTGGRRAPQLQLFFSTKKGNEFFSLEINFACSDVLIIFWHFMPII